MRRFLVLMLPILLNTGGCSSSKKELNEHSARALLVEHLHSETYPVTFNLEPLMRQTLVDYTSSSPSGTTGPAILKRLLDRTFVVQRSSVVSYPKISGTFSHRDNFLGGGFQTFDYTLESVPNSNQLTGKWIYTVTGQNNQTGNLTGTIGVDGKAILNTGDNGFQQPYVYSEEGGVAYLRRPYCFSGEICATILIGKPTAQKVDVKWYEYTFSPDFQKLITGRGQQTSVVGGGYEIGEVSGLRLVGDTEAAAAFAWQASLNDVGGLVLDLQKPTGTGRATFGKKPDGAWFVDQFSFQ